MRTLKETMTERNQQGLKKKKRNNLLRGESKHRPVRPKRSIPIEEDHREPYSSLSLHNNPAEEAKKDDSQGSVARSEGFHCLAILVLAVPPAVPQWSCISYLCFRCVRCSLSCFGACNLHKEEDNRANTDGYGIALCREAFMDGGCQQMISVNETTVKICRKNQITPIYALFLRGYEICSRLALPAFPWAGCVLCVLVVFRFL